MLISLLHPSRNRALKALVTYDMWINNASKQHEIEHILSLDTDDYDLDRYHTIFRNSRFVVAPNKNLVEATNIGAKECKGDILILLSDDFECYENWDIDIVKAFEGEIGCVLKTFDGVQKWIVTLPIMDRAYYEMQGYFYHPEYVHMFCDTEMSHKADIENRLLIRNDIFFNHAHYTTKQSKMDAINIKANSSWAQGQEVYLRHVRESFGCEDLDVMSISYEGLNHKKWLQSKI